MGLSAAEVAALFSPGINRVASADGESDDGGASLRQLAQVLQRVCDGAEAADGAAGCAPAHRSCRIHVLASPLPHVSAVPCVRCTIQKPRMWCHGNFPHECCTPKTFYEVGLFVTCTGAEEGLPGKLGQLEQWLQDVQELVHALDARVTSAAAGDERVHLLMC